MEPPRAARPNVASTLPDYSNAEQEFIMSAFSSAGFNPIRSIPEDIKASTVMKARLQKMQTNRRAVAEKRVDGGRTRDVFQSFEYILPPRLQTAADPLETLRQKMEEEKTKMLGRRAFKCSDTRAKLPYEDTFGSKDWKYPHLVQDYDAHTELKRRLKWIEDAKILHGPFVPSGTARPLERTDRSALPLILADVQKAVERDWSDHTFAVMNTEDDRIVVRFDLETVDSERGLHAYMNVFALSGEAATKYNLVRVTEDWPSKPGDGFLYYIFRPPWARRPPLKQ